MNQKRTILRISIALAGILFAISLGAHAQNSDAKKNSAHNKKRNSAAPKVSLSPRFVPGESFRYEMEYETTNETSRKGFATDPQGPASVVVDWNATLRIDILPPGDGVPPNTLRLKATYEKSTASVRSDTFDPSSAETSGQYHRLEGKSIGFTVGPDGKVLKVSGLEGIVDSEKAAQSAQELIAQMGAGSGAPLGGVSVGQTWSSEQPAGSLPLAGLAWHADSEYLGNEPCHPANPDLQTNPATSDPATSAKPSSNAAPDCAVILAKLSLVRPKSARETTPPEMLQRGVQSAGKWTGSAQSLLYVSLASGLVVSATQTGAEEMDVTLTSSHNTTMRYRGTISTRSHVALIVDDGKK